LFCNQMDCEMICFAHEKSICSTDDILSFFN
jgi:hypothetical protein